MARKCGATQVTTSQKLENLLRVYLRPQAANSTGWPALRRAMTS